MRVGWLQDDPGYVGGAEMTANDLRDAAPQHADIIDIPPGSTTPDDLDVAVVHNCMFYRPQDKPQCPVVRFIHDHRGPGPIDSPYRIYYSPVQRERVGLPGDLCPAPLDRTRFEPNGQAREGAVHVGTFGHPGKGQQLLAEYAAAVEPVTVYGAGPFPPAGDGIDYRGEIPASRVPDILWSHERFVHLPTEVEGFGRGVAEAWLAGCELVTNRNVGCLWWLENDPEALHTATDRFWELVQAHV